MTVRYFFILGVHATGARATARLYCARPPHTRECVPWNRNPTVLSTVSKTTLSMLSLNATWQDTQQTDDIVYLERYFVLSRYFVTTQGVLQTCKTDIVRRRRRGLALKFPFTPSVKFY